MAKLGDVDFADGVRASLGWLSQSLTYAGLLDGAPTAQMNRDLVSSARDRYRAAGRGPDPRGPLVIEPRHVHPPMRDHDPFGKRSFCRGCSAPPIRGDVKEGGTNRQVAPGSLWWRNQPAWRPRCHTESGAVLGPPGGRGDRSPGSAGRSAPPHCACEIKQVRGRPERHFEATPGVPEVEYLGALPEPWVPVREPIRLRRLLTINWRCWGASQIGPSPVGRMCHHALSGRASTSRCNIRVRVAESATERGARANCSARSTALRASRSFLRPAAVTSSK
jgi:hypothetical protein